MLQPLFLARQCVGLLDEVVAVPEALERQFQEGGATPKRAKPTDLSRSQSQTSLSLMAWERWAKSIAERWLTTPKMRASASTPVARARQLIIPRGMRSSICLRTTTLGRLGVVLFIKPLPSGGNFNSTPPPFSAPRETIL